MFFVACEEDVFLLERRSGTFTAEDLAGTTFFTVVFAGKFFFEDDFLGSDSTYGKVGLFMLTEILVRCTL